MIYDHAGWKVRRTRKFTGGNYIVSWLNNFRFSNAMNVMIENNVRVEDFLFPVMNHVALHASNLMSIILLCN